MKINKLLFDNKSPLCMVDPDRVKQKKKKKITGRLL